MPARDGHECNRLGVVSDLFDEVRGFLDDFVVPILGPLRCLLVLSKIVFQRYSNLGRVHLVDGDDELPDAEGEGEECVLAGLTVLRDTSFEFTGTSGDNKNGAIGLRGSGNHVLNEITMSGGVDDLRREGRLVLRVSGVIRAK